MRLHIVTYSFIIISFFISCKDASLPVIEGTTAGLINRKGVLIFKNKPYSGKVIYHTHNKYLKSEINYLKGKKHGLAQHWFPTGELKEKRTYTNGIKTGVHYGWWAPDILKFVYHFNTEGAYHGEVKEWYRDGQLYMYFNYNKGKELGSQRLWKNDGAIKANYTVVNGERFGLIGLKKCFKVTVNKDTIK